MAPPLPAPPRYTLDPDACPEHSAQCGRTTRLETRVRDAEEQGRDHEHRLTVIEVESNSRTRALSQAIPIVISIISTAVAIWSATRPKEVPQWHQQDTHSYIAPAVQASPSASRP